MSSLSAWCCLLVLLATCRSAPVQENNVPVTNNVEEVQRQEEELQSLLHLADQQAAREGVAVHEERVQHVQAVNGHKTEVETEHKTVVDSKTGTLLADVKQEVREKEPKAPGTPPEVKVKTEVNVPEEGVHETVVQTGSEDLVEDDDAGNYSPEAVAEYLYRTGDFERFYAELEKLVNSSMMTEAEAENYAQMVALEYDRIQMEEYENSILVQRRSPVDPYSVGMDISDAYHIPMEITNRYPVPLETPEPLLTLRPEQAILTPEYDADLDPYELLAASRNEPYVADPIQSLAAEVYEHLRDIDRVDDSETRDRLMDLVTSLLGEESQPSSDQTGWPAETVDSPRRVLGDKQKVPTVQSPNVAKEQGVAGTIHSVNGHLAGTGNKPAVPVNAGNVNPARKVEQIPTETMAHKRAAETV